MHAQQQRVGICMPPEMREKCRMYGINISQISRTAIEKEIQAKELKT